MTHLLSGTALAFALAFAMPVSAQAPQYPSGMPSQPGAGYAPPPGGGYAPPPASYGQQPQPQAPYAEETPPPGHKGYRHRKRYTGYRRHMRRPRHEHARYGRGSGDNIANRLNREELSKYGGGGMPPAGYQPAPGYPAPGYQTPGPKPRY